MGTNNETHDKDCSILVSLALSCCGVLMPIYFALLWAGSMANYGVMTTFKKAHAAFATTAAEPQGMPLAPQTMQHAQA